MGRIAFEVIDLEIEVGDHVLLAVDLPVELDELAALIRDLVLLVGDLEGEVGDEEGEVDELVFVILDLAVVMEGPRARRGAGLPIGVGDCRISEGSTLRD